MSHFVDAHFYEQTKGASSSPDRVDVLQRLLVEEVLRRVLSQLYRGVSMGPAKLAVQTFWHIRFWLSNDLQSDAVFAASQRYAGRDASLFGSILRLQYYNTTIGLLLSLVLKQRHLRL